MTINGTGDSKGTGYWNWALPVAPNTRATPGQGVWAKTGPATYEYTYQGYNYEIDGELNFTFLNKGTIFLTGCNTAEILGEINWFYPDGSELHVDAPMVMHRQLLDQQTPVQ